MYFLIKSHLNVSPPVICRTITTANASVDFVFLLLVVEWICIVYLEFKMLFFSILWETTDCRLTCLV